MSKVSKPIPQQVSHSAAVPRTVIELFDLQDILGWAAIGARHYDWPDIADEMQQRSDAINALLDEMGANHPSDN